MPSRRALCVYVTVGALIVGAVWAGSALPADTKGWLFRLVGVPAMPFAFGDTEGTLAWLDCYRAGHDLSKRCTVGYSQFPLTYPRTWFVFAYTPLRWDHVWPVAIVTEVLFFVVTILLVRPYPKPAVWPMLAALGSPPVLLGLERANTDLLVFLMLFLACVVGGWLGSALIVLSSSLKIYPIAAVASILEERRRTWAAASLVLLLFAGFSFSPLANWDGVAGSNLQYLSANVSFGHQVLPTLLNDILSKRGVHLSPFLRWAGLVTFLGTVPVTFWLARRLPLSGDAVPECDRRLIVCAMAVFLACFAIGRSYDYKHVHFLLAIPALAAIAARRGWMCLEGLYLALLLCGLWLTHDLNYTLSRVMQEMVEWILVPLSGVVAMWYMRLSLIKIKVPREG